MTKAASAEIGQRRYYHVPGVENCGCERGKWRPECRYTLTSVTTILKFLPKEWLGAWAAKVVAQTAIDELANLAAMEALEGREAVVAYLKGSPWRKRDAAAERGTAVHTAAETGATGEDVPENARKHVVQWHRFLDDHRPAIEWQEATVYNERHGYAGTLDLIANIGGERWLLDIKTTDDLRKLKWDWRLQLAAYRFAEYLDPVTPMPWTTHTGIVLLSEDGYRFLRVRAGGSEYKAFIAVLNVYRAIDPLMHEVVGEDV